MTTTNLKVPDINDQSNKLANYDLLQESENIDSKKCKCSFHIYGHIPPDREIPTPFFRVEDGVLLFRFQVGILAEGEDDDEGDEFSVEVEATDDDAAEEAAFSALEHDYRDLTITGVSAMYEGWETGPLMQNVREID